MAQKFFWGKLIAISTKTAAGKATKFMDLEKVDNLHEYLVWIYKNYVLSSFTLATLNSVGQSNITKTH